MLVVMVLMWYLLCSVHNCHCNFNTSFFMFWHCKGRSSSHGNSNLQWEDHVVDRAIYTSVLCCHVFMFLLCILITWQIHNSLVFPTWQFSFFFAILSWQDLWNFAKMLCGYSHGNFCKCFTNVFPMAICR